jgi:hypothetical protein
MNERHKLKEAHYFLTRLGMFSPHMKAFSFELSAFLSAARSVLQYAYEEAKTKSGGQLWYDNHVQNTPVIKYFKDARDLSIYVKPVVPNLSISAAPFTLASSIHASLNLQNTNHDKNVIAETNVKSPAHYPDLQSEPSATVSYRFENWSGTEDVVTLCHQYFTTIEAIVIDGQTKLFLSM